MVKLLALFLINVKKESTEFIKEEELQILRKVKERQEANFTKTL